MINNCQLYAGLQCPFAENCPCKNECENGTLNATPFLKELCCINCMATKQATDLYNAFQGNTTTTFNKVFVNVLWTLRGSIAQDAETVYKLDDIKTNFALFDKIVWLWTKTIQNCNANFLRECFLPLRSQIRLHEMQNTNLDAVPTMPL